MYSTVFTDNSFYTNILYRPTVTEITNIHTALYRTLLQTPTDVHSCSFQKKNETTGDGLTVGRDLRRPSWPEPTADLCSVCLTLSWGFGTLRPGYRSQCSGQSSGCRPCGSARFHLLSASAPSPTDTSHICVFPYQHSIYLNIYKRPHYVPVFMHFFWFILLKCIRKNCSETIYIYIFWKSCRIHPIGRQLKTF